MTVRSRQRTVRAGVFTLVCVLLTITGHSWLAAGSIRPAGLVAGSVALFLAARWAGHRQWGWGAIVTALMAGQLGLHALFTAFADPRTSSGPLTPDWARMDMAGMPMNGAETTLSAAHMVAGHLLAAVVSGGWLAYGEAAVWRAARRAGNRARVTATLVVHTTRPLVGFPPEPPHVLGRGQAWEGLPRSTLSALITRCSPRRGPPRTAAIPMCR